MAILMYFSLLFLFPYFDCVFVFFSSIRFHSFSTCILLTRLSVLVSVSSCLIHFSYIFSFHVRLSPIFIYPLYFTISISLSLSLFLCPISLSLSLFFSISLSVSLYLYFSISLFISLHLLGVLSKRSDSRWPS